ncbi:response regulator transcription factor [Paenibacillus sp. CAU 1782]
MKVMIVDDEEMIRRGLEKILGKMGLDIEVVGSYGNGMEAWNHLSRLDDRGLDVLITDIKMPMMDGLKLAEKMQGKPVSLIVLSGFSEFEYARRALRSGVVDYLLKPVDKSLLREALQKIKAARGAEPLSMTGVQRQEGDYRIGSESPPGGNGGSAELSLGQIDDGGKTQNFAGLSPNNIQGAGGAYEEIYLAESSGRLQQASQHLARVHPAAQQIRQLLEREYDKNLDMDILAEMVDMSANYLSRLFKQETGMTITDYLIHVRIDKAKQYLLDHHHLKNYEIAQLVGYSDPVYFNKLFKKSVGITPREFRTQGGA